MTPPKKSCLPKDKKYSRFQYTFTNIVFLGIQIFFYQVQGKQTKCFPLGSNAWFSIYLDIFDKFFCFSDFVLSSLSCPVKATALFSNFLIVVRKSNNQVRTHHLIIRKIYIKNKFIMQSRMMVSLVWTYHCPWLTMRQSCCLEAHIWASQSGVKTQTVL